MLSLLADSGLGGTLSGLGYDPGTTIGSATTGLNSIISNIVGLLTIIAGITFLIYFTIGGLTWITAGGDTGKIEEAKDRMTGGAIGMIIVVSAWAISWIIGQVLGVNFLNPAESLRKLRPNAVQQDSSSKDFLDTQREKGDELVEKGIKQ